MGFGRTRLRLTLLLGALAACGCRSELRYRTPADDGASGPSAAPGAARSASTPAQERRGGRPADFDLARAVRKGLDSDPGLGMHRVDARVERGVVTLSGSVGSGPAAERAVREAELTWGVLAVVDRLDVVAPKVADRDLVAAVRGALAGDPATSSAGIDVQVEGGKVRLGGEVATEAQRALASEVAWSVRGVSAVENAIASAPRLRPDLEIRRDVERRLAIDASLHARPIRVHVEQGRVRLHGVVRSAWHVRRAREAALLSGVRGVDTSQLGVEPAQTSAPLERSDEETAAAVRDMLRFDPRLDGALISVGVREGTVTLAGSVSTLRAKLAAEQSALATAGVWDVDDALQVRPPAGLDTDDARLAAAVRERLRNDAVVGDEKLEVAAENGEIVLRGVVASRYQNECALLAAATVPGVLAIDDRLTVAEPGARARDDTAIESDVRSRLSWDARLEASDVSVEVHEGVVFVRGDVVDRAAFDAVLESAFAARPREVVIGLRRAAATREL